MTLNGESTIIPCEDSSDVPVVQCDFVSIGDLENKEKDSIVGKEPEKDQSSEMFHNHKGLWLLSCRKTDTVTIALIFTFIPAPRISLISHFLYSAKLPFISALGQILNKVQLLIHHKCIRHFGFLLLPWVHYPESGCENAFRPRLQASVTCFEGAEWAIKYGLYWFHILNSGPFFFWEIQSPPRRRWDFLSNEQWRRTGGSPNTSLKLRTPPLDCPRQRYSFQWISHIIEVRQW